MIEELQSVTEANVKIDECVSFHQFEIMQLSLHTSSLYFPHRSKPSGALQMRSHFIKYLISFVVVYYDFIFLTYFTRMPRMTLSQKRLLVSLTPTRFCVFNKRRERRQLYALNLRCVRHVVLVTVAAFPLLLHQEWWNSLTMSMLITTTRPSTLAITSTNLLVGLCYDENKFNLPQNIFPKHNIQDCLMWNIDCLTCFAYTLCNMQSLCLACAVSPTILSF